MNESAMSLLVALARTTLLLAAAAVVVRLVLALAVVVDFDDQVSTVTASFFDSLVFAPPVSGRGSVRDYFDEVSYGQLDIVTVNLPSSLGWVRAPSTYAHYTNGNYCWGAYPQNCRKLAEDVVDAVLTSVETA